MALITRTSFITGITRTLDVPQYDQLEFDRILHAWREGKVELENAMPNISLFALNFIKTGVTEDEWDKRGSV